MLDQPITRFIDPEEVASRLGCSPRTLKRMVERGELPRPARLTPRRVGWAEQTFQQWAAERVAQAA